MGKSKVRRIIEFSFDDGSIDDLHVVELLLAYNFVGTFYIPNTTALSPATIKSISDCGMIIGGHTVSHPDDMKRLSNDKQFREIFDNKCWLEKITGKKVTKFAYPSGRFNHTTIAAAKKAGMKQARKTGWGNIRKPYDKFRICPTVFIHPNITKFNGMLWHEFGEKKFFEKGANYHHVWGHATDIDQYKMWNEFEKYLLFLSQNL